MPSPVCSCITAGFGVKFLRRYRISIPHGLLSPVGHPGYKNDRGERVSSKTGDRSIYAAGPPSAKAGGDLPTMRRHNTCRAKKHSTHRRVSPTLAKGTEKRARRPHPASPRMPRSIRTKESGWVPPWACRIYWFSPTRKHLHPSYAANGVRRGLPYTKGPSPSPPNRASAPGHSRIHGEKGRIPQAPPPSRRRTEAIRRGYRTSRNSLKTTSFLAM